MVVIRAYYDFHQSRDVFFAMRLRWRYNFFVYFMPSLSYLLADATRSTTVYRSYIFYRPVGLSRERMRDFDLVYPSWYFDFLHLWLRLFDETRDKLLFPFFLSRLAMVDRMMSLALSDE